MTLRIPVYFDKTTGSYIDFDSATDELAVAGLTLYGPANFGGDLDMMTFKVINLADPTNPQEAATKAYADAIDTRLIAADTTLDNKITALETEVDNIATTAISALTARLDTAEDDILTNSGGIAGNASAIASNAAANAQNSTLIANNTAANTALGVRVTSLEADVAVLEPAVISSLGTRMTAAEVGIATNGTSISNHGSRLTSIEAVNTNLSGRVSTLESEVALLEPAVIADLSTRMVTAESSIVTNRDGIAFNDARILGIQTFNTEISGRVSTLESEVALLEPAVIAGIETRLTSAEGNISTSQSNITFNNTLITNNTTAISTLSGRVSTLESEVALLEPAIIADLSTRMVTAEGNIVTNRDDIAFNDARILGIQTFNTEISGRVSTLETTVAAIEPAVIVDIGNRLTIAEGTVATNSTSITNLDGRVTTLEAEVALLDPQTIDDLVTRVAAAEATVLTNSGNITENAEAIITNATAITNNAISISNSAASITGLDGRITTLEAAVGDLDPAFLVGVGGILRIGDTFRLKFADESLIADASGVRINPDTLSANAGSGSITVTASEAVLAGDPVAYDPSTPDHVFKADADKDAVAARKQPIGIATASVAPGSPVEVLMFGQGSNNELLSQSLVPAPGTRVWLDVGGGLTVTPPSARGESVILMGYARSISNILVRVQEYGAVAL